MVEEEAAELAAYALKLLQRRELTIASTEKDPQTGKLVTHTYPRRGAGAAPAHHHGALDQLRGAQIEDVRLGPVSLSVAMRHSNRLLLELLPDSSLGPENERWAVELPTGRAVIVFGKKRWALQPNR